MERERFDDVVDEWLRYQASLVGRLRTMLFWRGVQRHLPTVTCDVLDLGEGSVEIAAENGICPLVNPIDDA